MVLQSAIPAAGALTMSVGYENPRTWFEQWSAISHHLAELHKAYDVGIGVSNTELKRRADTYFIACWHLYDWLINDPAVTQISKQVVDSFVMRRLPLQICRGYANTTKHFELSDEKRLRARVTKFIHGPEGRRLDVQYWSSTQQAETIDALHLAMQCYQEWLTLLQQQGLALSP